MSRLPVRRNLAILMLAAILLVPCAVSATPRSAGELRAESSEMLPRLWNLFTRLWSEAGCILDPNGRCKGAH